MQIKAIIEKPESMKRPAEYVGLDTEVINEAIKTILDLHLQCEQYESEQIILRDEKKYLSECYDVESKKVAKAGQNAYMIAKKLQEVEVKYNKALSTLAAHGIYIGDSQ